MGHQMKSLPRALTKKTSASPARSVFLSVVAVVVLGLGQFVGLAPSSWGQMMPKSLINPDQPMGLVSKVTQEDIVIDGNRYRLAPQVSVKWDMGGTASLEDIQPGNLVQFLVKDFQIVLVIIAQPG